MFPIQVQRIINWLDDADFASVKKIEYFNSIRWCCDRIIGIYLWFITIASDSNCLDNSVIDISLNFYEPLTLSIFLFSRIFSTIKLIRYSESDVSKILQDDKQYCARKIDPNIINCLTAAMLKLFDFFIFRDRNIHI